MTSRDEHGAPSVAVIGGGWYGCHIAHALSVKGFKVVLYEKGASLFHGASGKNQFRLHAGFHYPRSSITRHQIKEGRREFLERLPEFVHALDTCLYAVSSAASVIDFGTFKQIFQATGTQFTEINPQVHGLTNVEGCISTNEEMLLFVDTPKKYYEVGKSCQHGPPNEELCPAPSRYFLPLTSLSTPAHNREFLATCCA